MAVYFAAVHDRAPWRKHGGHKDIDSAINGRDGAYNLLRRRDRVAKKWSDYGDVLCVFVWEDEAQHGRAFRVDPNQSGAVQSACVEMSRVLSFDKNQGCSSEEIEECFSDISANLYPDELPPSNSYIEGLARPSIVNRFERSLEARNTCIVHHGSTCQVCGLDFSHKYGELGAGFIHVHHLVPVASVGAEYRVDPINDLIPVCPNCHAMLHRRDPPLDVEELRTLMHE